MTFYFPLLLALTVRFLTKRFIGEYQSIMRKYIAPQALFVYFAYSLIFCRHIHMMMADSSHKSLPFLHCFIHRVKLTAVLVEISSRLSYISKSAHQAT